MHEGRSIGMQYPGWNDVQTVRTASGTFMRLVQTVVNLSNRTFNRYEHETCSEWVNMNDSGGADRGNGIKRGKMEGADGADNESHTGGNNGAPHEGERVIL